MKIAKLNSKSKRRHSSLFDRLEPRQMMAVDVSATTIAPKGAYGEGDLFDVEIKLRNSGSSSTQIPVFVNVFLSKDKKLGNGDDLTFGGNVFTGIGGKKTASLEFQANISSQWSAGDYYIITTVDPFVSLGSVESNRSNNTTVSATKEIRIVTEKLADGAVVRGTPKNDLITVQGNWANEIVTVNGKSYLYKASGMLKPLSIQAGRGNDKIVCDSRVNDGMILSGNAGNDTIVGGNSNDTLYGDAGHDRLYAGDGADIVYGGSGNDILDGGIGVDQIFGHGGKDKGVKHVVDTFTSVETML